MTIYLNVFLYRQLKKQLESTRLSSKPLPGLTPFFYVENLIPKKTGVGAQWSRIGLVNGTSVQVSAIFWPGRGYKGVEKHSKRLRVAMAEAPPFIMTSPLIENTTCLLGVICIKVCLWRVYQYLGNFSYWTYIFVLGFFFITYGAVYASVAYTECFTQWKQNTYSVFLFVEGMMECWRKDQLLEWAHTICKWRLWFVNQLFHMWNKKIISNNGDDDEYYQ